MILLALAHNRLLVGVAPAALILCGACVPFAYVLMLGMPRRYRLGYAGFWLGLAVVAAALWAVSGFS